MTIRTILADDHPATTAGLHAVLSSDNEIEVAAMVSSPTELFRAIETIPTDIVITDFSMEIDSKCEPDGLQMVQNIRKRHPDVGLIVFTMTSNSAILQAILQFGVEGLISKVDHIIDLPSILRLVYNGHKFIGKGIAAQIKSNKNSSMVDTGLNVEISPSELDVIRLFARGVSTLDIGRRLHRSPKTISNQKRIAMHKLGIANDMELFAYARANGIAF